MNDQKNEDLQEMIEDSETLDMLEKKFSELLAEKGESPEDNGGTRISQTEKEVDELWRPIEELSFSPSRREIKIDETIEPQNEIEIKDSDEEPEPQKELDLQDELRCQEPIEEEHQEQIQEDVEEKQVSDEREKEETEIHDISFKGDVEEGQPIEASNGEDEEANSEDPPETEPTKEDHANNQTEKEHSQAEETLKEEIKKKSKERDRKIIKSFLIKLAVTAAALWLIFTFVFGVIRIEGEAMYPRLRDGDIGLYYRIEKDYNIGDVVVFENNGFTCTARVVAKAGDVVEVSDAGALIVNRNVQFEEVFYPTERIPGGIQYPYTVGENSYFLLCDFRTQSSDSRYMGAIGKSDIKGKIVTILRRRGI